MMSEHATGLFRDADNARDAVDRPLNASFRADKIGVLISETQEHPGDWRARRKGPLGARRRWGEMDPRRLKVRPRALAGHAP
jgi:hypothetical protein